MTFVCVVMEQMQGKDSPTFNVDGIDANVTDACQKMSTKSINYGSMNKRCTNTRLFTRYICTIHYIVAFPLHK